MFDFDPRDYDSRDDDRHGNTPNRGNRGASDDRDRDHQQTFHSGLVRERELEHDVQIYVNGLPAQDLICSSSQLRWDDDVSEPGQILRGGQEVT